MATDPGIPGFCRVAAAALAPVRDAVTTVPTRLAATRPANWQGGSAQLHTADVGALDKQARHAAATIDDLASALNRAAMLADLALQVEHLTEMARQAQAQVAADAAAAADPFGGSSW